MRANPIILLAVLLLSGMQNILAQEVRPIITYSKSTGFENLNYHSDSVMLINTPYGSLFLNKERKWQTFGASGLIYTSQNSKLYHITKEGRWFSEIEPSKQLFHDYADNNIYTNKEVEYFKVVNDRFFLLKYKYDTLIFKIDFFKNYTLKQNVLLRLDWDEISAKIQPLNDSIIYIITSKNIYRKNCNDGKLIKTPNTIGVDTYSFFCKDSIVVFANNINIYYSSNYAKTFKKIYVSAQQAIDANSIQIVKYKIQFNEGLFINKRNFTLYKLDILGNKTSITNHGNFISKVSNTYAKVACDHLDTFPTYVWLDSINCLATTTDGDVYKLNLAQKTVNYLGGSYNLGVRYVKASKNARFIFQETGNYLWSFSKDTGKSWKIPIMKFQSRVVKAEFLNNAFYILSGSKISVYQYTNQRIDTSFFNIPLIIDDFYIKDKDKFVLISKKQAFEYDINSKQIKALTPITPFDKIGFLKKSSRLLALTNVGIFYSDDFGKTWPQSTLTGFENFQSLTVDNGFLINESLENTIYLNVKFNDHPVVMRSIDNGNSFESVKDTISERSRAMDVYQHELYMIDTFGQFSEFNFNFKTFRNTLVWSNCMLSGIQTTDIGMLMWNNRSEFFINDFDISHLENKSLVCFPNPLLANQTLKIKVQTSTKPAISSIDLIDLQGKPIEQVSFELDTSEQAYHLKIQKSLTPQIYILKVTTNDKQSSFQRLLVQ